MVLVLFDRSQLRNQSDNEKIRSYFDQIASEKSIQTALIKLQ